MDIRSVHPIKTAENTVIEVELAGFATRILAFLIDLLMLMLLIVIIVVVLKLVSKLSPELAETAFNLFLDRRLSGDAFKAVLFGALFGVSTVAFMYHFFQEWLWNGKTVGKHLLKIRVVRNNGQAIGFWEAFGRNIMRFFMDVYPIGLGIYPMMISSREKRFGDFLVGTLVISDQKIARPALEIPQELSKQPEAPSDSALNASLIHPEEFELLRSYLSRRDRLDKTHRAALALELARHFQTRLYLSDEATADPKLLETLYQEYQQQLTGNVATSD